ncbi:bifunctional methylenetetrahydrofolate dehydrogenase/cyclohydrolase, mitochondrial-like [Ptychodera flava]|uniref:bifunctional methylenetetrahydrofolate dehydrogenase/cyclohydrolase, mitochondrial-like n=1 Tax=Ptychodera flava TaxID=63121 RepID=UPI00396A5DD3
MAVSSPFCRVFTRFCRSLSSAALKPAREVQQRSVSKIIDGKAVAKEIRAEVRLEVEEWVRLGNRPPHLAVVLVGDDPASASYVRSKTRAARQAGISAETIRRPSTISQEELLDLVHSLNTNNDVDGILVQLPVPKHINERTICDSVRPEKDVDGFHVMNVGRFCLDQRALLPATPYGIMELIKRTGIDTIGKNAVVCGRSKNVGMPIAMLLHTDSSHDSGIGADSTVTICHRNTPPDQLRLFTKTADILVVAVGIPGLIKADMVKEGVVVIDVGINRVIDEESGQYRLVGDVDYKGVCEKASYITPVPGGVGPMTVAMLMKNTLIAARKDYTYSN